MKKLFFRVYDVLITLLREKLFREIQTLKIALGQTTLVASKSSHQTYQRLSDASFRVFSQFGEDGILDFLCDTLKIIRPKVLELGAGNFNECNSRALAEYRGAEVVAVDARKDLISSIKKLDLYWKNHIFPLETWITPESIKGIQDFAHISIDLDGNDYWVAQAMDLTNIKIIVVEYNPLFGHKKAISIKRNDNFDRTKAHFSWDYFGASLRAYIHLFEKSGFCFVGTNLQCFNAFFIRLSEIDNLNFKVEKDLSKFINGGMRDGRNLDSRLSYKSYFERVRDIENLPVVDVVTEKEIFIGENILKT
jgi:hypothetical protein